MSESLKETVIEAALELIDRDGLNLAYESISYAKVFEHLQNEYGLSVTRASVHKRIWVNQNGFRRDVLASSIQHFPTGYLSSTLLWTAVEADGPEAFAVDVGARPLRDFLTSVLFGQFQSVKALASRFDDPRATEALHDQLNGWAAADIAAGRLTFSALQTELGLQPRSELGLTGGEVGDILYSLVKALLEGGYLDYNAGSHDVAAPVEFGLVPTSSAVPWCIISIGVKSVLDFLFEKVSGPLSPSGRSTARGPPEPPAAVIEIASFEAGHSTRSRQELKQLMLDAAVELLLRGGLQLKADSLTYAAVFAYIKESRGLVVNRSSIHPRFWTSNEEFRLEVLTRSLLANACPLPVVAELFKAPTQAKRPDGAIHRRQAAYDLIRTVADSLAGVGLDSKHFRRLLQVKAALLDQEESTVARSLRAAVQQINRERIDHNKVLVQANILGLGFVAKPENGLSESAAIELLVVLSMISISGIMLNELAGISTANVTHRLPRADESGGYDDWKPAGIAMRSYFDQLYREDVPS